MPMEARPTEFAILQKRALTALENITPPSESSIFLMRLSIYPAFFTYSSWVVFSETNLLIWQTTWDRPSDYYRFIDPMEGLKKGWHTSPTLAISEKYMDSLEFYSLFSQIQQIPMPKAKRGIALDGEVWYLSVPNFFENRVLDWNMAGQKDKDWEPVAQWAANMREFFLTVFNLS